MRINFSSDVRRRIENRGLTVNTRCNPELTTFGVGASSEPPRPPSYGPVWLSYLFSFRFLNFFSGVPSITSP